MERSATIVGGGLAGCEASRILAKAQIPVRLYEMRPKVSTAAHKSTDLAELVCSNSLGSQDLSTGKGLLLSEMRQLGSLVVEAATQNAVPAGNSLAVAREGFAKAVTTAIGNTSQIQLSREEVSEIPTDGAVLLATGPLTSDALSASIAKLTGQEYLYFYDSIAPIVLAESLDMEKVYAASRYGKGTPDFLNCPMEKDEYEGFIDALLAAESVPAKNFEKEYFFEGCMPIEELASRGRQTLAFGPMRPVGLERPDTGKIAHAVVQLRCEDAARQLYNLVGFQTKLKYPEQKRVFRMIPGLENAEFVRLGSVHRNTFINSPTLLSEDLSLRGTPHCWFAGQMIGVEGYADSAAMGMMAAIAMVCRISGKPFVPPPSTTAIGGLMNYLREAKAKHFQPMNINFGLLPPLPGRFKGRGAKRAKRLAMVERAQQDFGNWIADQELGWLREPPPQMISHG